MSEKWWDMSDDELDDLFREASDKVNVPFESAAYNKLRQKIAEQPMSEPPKGFKKRWLLLLAGLFLMVGVGLVYRFGNDSNNNSTKITKNIEKKNTVKPLNSASSSETNPPSSESSPTTVGKSGLPSMETQTKAQENIVKKSKLPFIANSPIITNENLEKSSIGTQTTANENLKKSSVGTQTTADGSKSQISSVEIQKTTKEKSNITPFNTSEKVVENKKMPSSLNDPKTYSLEQNKVIENINFNSYNTKNKLVRFNNSKNKKDREGKNYPLNSQIIEQNDSQVLENTTIITEKSISEETVNKTNFYDVDFLKNKDSKSLLMNINTKLPEYTDTLPRTMKPIKFSKFGMRLVLSPDFNSIGNLSKMALGGSVGLLFEYKISKKLVIQTGMVYSGKSYVGSFEDYNNWKDWKGYHPSKPTEVDGGCKVFDIPINLRVNLFQKPKQTWFISSGVSSYWMMNENYKYNYAWDSPREVGWNDDSKYYFSMMNFSVGFEKQISKRLNFQIEPYLKTPLKNLGRGGVSLYSSGVLFSTKYEF